MERETNVKAGKTNRKNKAAFGLQALRRPHGEHLSHDEAQVAGHRGNQVTLLNLLDPAKPTPPRPPVSHMWAKLRSTRSLRSRCRCLLRRRRMRRRLLITARRFSSGTSRQLRFPAASARECTSGCLGSRPAPRWQWHDSPYRRRPPRSRRRCPLRRG